MYYEKVNISNSVDVLKRLEAMKKDSASQGEYFDKIDYFLFIENDILVYESNLKFEGKKAIFYKSISDELSVEIHEELSDELLNLYEIFEGDYSAEERISAYEEIHEIKKNAIDSLGVKGSLSKVIRAVKNSKSSDKVVNFIYKAQN